MTASLDNAYLNLHFIKDYIFDDFKQIFATNQKKSLIFEKELESHITLFVSTTQLTTWGVMAFHFLHEITNVKPLNNHVIFIISKKPSSYQIITDYMTKYENVNYHVVVIPDAKYTLGNNMLERANLFTKFTISNLPITLIPIDNDLLSMEFINTNSFDIADGIILLEQLYGIIPVIQGIGKQSQFVVEEVLHNRNKVLHTESRIARMIIIDRTCDYITPFLTPITYAGAMDVQFGIESNKVRIMNEKNEKVIKVNSDDSLYELIRDLRLENIQQLLVPEKEKYVEMYKMMDDAKRNGDLNMLNKAIDNTRMLNKKYKETSIINHYTLLGKIIIDYDIIDIEQNLLLGLVKSDDQFMTIWLGLLKKKTPVIQLIKLICLYCIVSDGITVDFVQTFDHYIITYYSTDYVFLFDNLFAAGILFPRGNYKYRWDKLKSKFQLIAEDNGDIAYVFNGYAPLSCRLIENALTVPLNKLLGQKQKGVLFKGWMDKKINDRVNLVDDAFYAIQETNLEQDNILLVYFVGGITHAEIAALRYISKMNKDKHIIIATTCIINGNKMIQSLSKL